VCFHWHGAARPEQVRNAGPLGLLVPLLERLDVAALIDRPLPADPQLEFSHGQVLSLLLAARRCNPTALRNVAAWAEKSGADRFGNIPPDQRNDDRLGRALDAFFTQRHALRARVAEPALRLAQLSCQRLHFDPTARLGSGASDTSTPRPDDLPLPPATPAADFPPAPLTSGHDGQRVSDHQLVPVGGTAVVDAAGAWPLLRHVRDGNRNGPTAIEPQFQLLPSYVPPPTDLLRVSDRGTCAVAPVARWHRHGGPIRCAAPWPDEHALWDEHRDRLTWLNASYLSREPQRRRPTNAPLPREPDERAVVRHPRTDPETAAILPCRVRLVFRTADQKVGRRNREKTLAQLPAGREPLAASVRRGQPRSTPAAMARRVAQLLGNPPARHYFRGELVPWTPDEQAAGPPPTRGCRRATHRWDFPLDAAAAEADAVADGYAVRVTTASLTGSADTLVRPFQQPNYVELLHQPWKSPLAVRPVFGQSPQRVEALGGLLQLALTAYQLLERRYRPGVAPDAPVQEKRLTSESLLRPLRVYGWIGQQVPTGRVV
jgi:Domain of unknown function (DUF4277)